MVSARRGTACARRDARTAPTAEIGTDGAKRTTMRLSERRAADETKVRRPAAREATENTERRADMVLAEE